jgi:hypothetical protein
VEIINADEALSVASVEAFDWGFDAFECISGSVWENEFLKMSDFGLKPIQVVGSEQSL